MASLQSHLTDRDREIARLKEKLRDLSKKLRAQTLVKVNPISSQTALNRFLTSHTTPLLRFILLTLIAKAHFQTHLHSL